jgi:preprotein translocase subunit SecG
LVLVILVQRGRGGGLAGALGGVGGSSAFGTRAGDVFTRITVGIFLVWVFLACGLVLLMARKSPLADGNSKRPAEASAPDDGPAPPAPLGEGTPAGESSPTLPPPVADSPPEQEAAPAAPPESPAPPAESVPATTDSAPEAPATPAPTETSPAPATPQ